MRTGNRFFLISTFLVLAACAGQKGIAPPPPDFYQAAFQNYPDSNALDIANVDYLQSIEPAAGMGVQEDYRIDANQSPDDKKYKRYTSKGFKDILKKDGCHVKDRFDRKAVVAYQWGRNRVGFDVDGIGFDSMDIEEVKFTYRLRLQPQLSNRDKCRYNSSWQGMFGSGYNEFSLREDDTVMDRVQDLKKEIANRLE